MSSTSLIVSAGELQQPVPRGVGYLQRWAAVALQTGAAGSNWLAPASLLLVCKRLRASGRNSVALSPRADNTDRRPPLVGEGSAGATYLTAVNLAIKLGFIHRNRSLFVEVAPQLSSRG
jgi:hypothetical protein